MLMLLVYKVILVPVLVLYRIICVCVTLLSVSGEETLATGGLAVGQIMKMLPSESPIVCTTSYHIYRYILLIYTYDKFAWASFICDFSF